MMFSNSVGRWAPCRRASLFVALVAYLLVASADAQQPRDRVLRGAPVCASCTLSVRLVATLGSLRDSVLLSELPLSVGVTSKGLFLADAFSFAGVAVFDSLGTQREIIWRPGQGPNELPNHAKWYFNHRGDSLFIITNGRVFVYGPDLREVRRFNVTSDPRYALLRDGSIAHLRSAQTDSAMAVVVHSSSGVAFADFVFRPKVMSPSCSGCRQVSMSAASDNNDLWLAFSEPYELQRWTKSGQLTASLKVEGSPWRERWLPQMKGGWGSPRGPTIPIIQLSARSDGLLLVSAQGPSASPPMSKVDTSIRSMAAINMRAEPGLDQIFEVVDPARGVLASTRVTQRGLYLLPNGRHAMRPIAGTSGETRLEIYEIVLSR